MPLIFDVVQKYIALTRHIHNGKHKRIFMVTVIILVYNDITLFYGMHLTTNNAGALTTNILVAKDSNPLGKYDTIKSSGLKVTI